MTAQIKELTEAQTCKGISVRTTNIAEISHETAKLGKLWQKFYQNHVSHLEKGEDVYGIYHNYESDDVGAFDVVASWKATIQQDEQDEQDQVISGDSLNAANTSKNSNLDSKLDSKLDSNLVKVNIPVGKYLVFSEHGRMPNTVMNAWEKAWEYFNSVSCEHTRLYNVDFEHYIDGNLEFGQVDLYIGVE